MNWNYKLPNYSVIETAENANKIASEILELNCIVGFDTETRVKKNSRVAPIDLIQIYIPCRLNENGKKIKGHCYLFHMAKILDGNQRTNFPEMLAKVLRSNNVAKACFAPDNDKKWLWSDFHINAIGMLDVQTFAQLKREPKIGLDSLASKYIRGWPPKNKKMRFQRWDIDLTQEMIYYAVSDAFASYYVLRVLAPDLFYIPQAPKIDIEANSGMALKLVLPYLKGPTSKKEIKRRCASHLWKDDFHIAHRREMARQLFNFWVQNGYFLRQGKEYIISEPVQVWAQNKCV